MQLEQVKISESLQNIARIGVVFLDEVANGPCDPALTREIEETCEKLRLRLAGRKPAEIEALAPARKLYRRTGVDPTRERPSSERLLRRALKGHNLAKINRLVDCINLVSLELQCPLGLYDWAALAPPVLVRIGRPGENFRAIHDRPLNLEGKLVSIDEKGPFGNPSYDSHRTRVCPDTAQALALCWTPIETPLKYIENVLEVIANRTGQYCKARVAASGIL